MLYSPKKSSDSGSFWKKLRLLATKTQCHYSKFFSVLVVFVAKWVSQPSYYLNTKEPTKLELFIKSIT